MASNQKQIPWAKIQSDWLQGSKREQLAKKYAKFGVSAKQISDKAYREGWGKESAKLSEKISEKIVNAVLVERDEILRAYKEIAFNFSENTSNRLKALQDLAKIAGLFDGKADLNNTKAPGIVINGPNSQPPA